MEYGSPATGLNFLRKGVDHRWGTPESIHSHKIGSKQMGIELMFQNELENRKYDGRLGNNIDSKIKILNKNRKVHGLNELDTLSIAIVNNDINLVKIILDENIYKFSQQQDWLALACEFYQSDKDIILELLKCENIDYNLVGGSLNESPLYYAIKHKIDVVKLFIDSNKIIFDKVYDHRFTLVHHAIVCNNYESIQLLINYPGFTPSKKDIGLILENGQMDIICDLIKLDKFQNFNISEHFFNFISNNHLSDEIIAKIVPFLDGNYSNNLGKTIAMELCEKNYIISTRLLLTIDNINLSIVDDKGLNCLMYGILHDNSGYNTEIIKLLLNYIEKNMDIDKKKELYNTRDIFGRTALIIAITKNSNEITKLIYETGCADLNLQDLNGCSILHHIAVLNDVNTFKMIQSSELLDINIQNFDGNTPIMCLGKNITDAQNLFEEFLKFSSIDLNVKNNKGHNLLQIILDELYKKSSKSSVICEEPVLSSLSYHEFAPFTGTSFGSMGMPNNSSATEQKLSKTKHHNIITSLIKKGIDINNRDFYDKSPLLVAIDNSDVTLFNLLINTPTFDPNTKFNHGETYLMYLINKINSGAQNDLYTQVESTSRFFGDKMDFHHNPQPFNNKNIDAEHNDIHFTFFMKLLNNQNVNINATDYLGNTVLSMLIGRKIRINLDDLINKHKSINLNCVTHEGTTPLMLAGVNGSWDYVKILLSHGADPTLKNNLAGTTLHIYNGILESFKRQIPTESENKKTWFF